MVEIELDTINNYYERNIRNRVRNGEFNEVVEYLKTQNIYTYLDDSYSCTTEDLRTPLHDICDCENQEDVALTVVQVLNWLSKFTEEREEEERKDVRIMFVEKKDKYGYTALDYALKRENLGAFFALIDYGAHAYAKFLSDEIRNGNFKMLHQFLDNFGSEFLDLVSKDEERTVLHDVCDCENEEGAKKMLNHFLEWYERRKPLNDNTFLNKQDKQGNTALHYALKRKNRYAVKALINSEANVNIANNKKEEAITKVYKMFPKSIMTLLDGRHREESRKLIQFGSDVAEDDDDKNREIECNFDTITGIDVDRSKIYETYMLSKLLDLKMETQANILEYPIVQLFLDLKWGKMKWLIYISMVFHMTWSVISCGVIWNIFMTKYGNSTNSTKEWERLENKSWQLSSEKDSQQDFSSVILVSNEILFSITLIVAMKEIIEAKSTPKFKMYIKQIENWGQWILITSIYLLYFNFKFSKFLPLWLDYNLSIVAVTTSCLLILGQLNKDPKLCIYVEMFLESLKDFGLLFLMFSPILVAFTLGFRMMMPLNEEFHLWPPWGLIKIEAMSTGEYNYNEIYNHEVVAIKMPKNVLILAFIIMVSIVLTNLLIGLVVSDVKNLKDRARVSRFRTQLEQMYLMEAFIANNMPWWPSLSEACRITENKSMMTVCPLCYFKPIGEFFLDGWKDMWKWIVNKGKAVSSHISKCKKSIRNAFWKLLGTIYNRVPTEEEQQPSNCAPHIVKKKMKAFSEESRIRLRELKAKEDKNKQVKVCPCLTGAGTGGTA